MVHPTNHIFVCMFLYVLCVDVCVYFLFCMAKVHEHTFWYNDLKISLLNQQSLLFH